MDPFSTNTILLIITGLLLSLFYLPLGLYFASNNNPIGIVAGVTSGLIATSLVYIGYTNMPRQTGTRININDVNDVNKVNNINKNKVINN